MKFSSTVGKMFPFCVPLKLIRIMKLFCLFMIIGLIHVSAKGLSQITLSVKNAPLEQVLNKIKKQSGYSFLYNHNVLNTAKPVSLDVINITIDETLQKCMLGQPLTYKIIDKTIIIKPKHIIEDVTEQKVIDVTGKVLDETKQPLPGASVKIKGTTIGTVTDKDGSFVLKGVDENAVLIVSFIGYKPTEVNLNSNTSITIILSATNSNLEQVVVVGYGSQKKSSLTGAISTIKASDFKNRPVTQASQIFYSLAPGISVNSSTGEAGNGQTTFRIRGVGTLNDASALILVDGIEAPIDNINPNDIESVSILKDAAAAAIYGSRAANGVVLITTKRAKFDSKTVISYNGYSGVTNPTILPKMVTDNATYLKLYKEAAANTNISSVGITDKDIERYSNLPSTNWFDVIFNKQAPIQEHAISLSSGNERISSYVSIGYLGQTGSIKKTDFDRYNARVNLDAKLNKYFKTGTSLAYSYSYADLATKEGPEYGTGLSTDVNSLVSKGSLAFEAALTQHPIVPIYNAQGRYATLEQKLGIQRNRNNGQSILDNETLQQKESKLLGNIYLEYEPIEKLKVKATFGINNQQTGYVDTRKEYSNYDLVTGNLVLTAVPGSLLTDVQYFSQNFTTVLQSSYEKKLNKHTISGLVGFNQESSRQKTNNTLQTNFSSTSLVTLGNGATNLVVNTQQGEWALRSFFARLNYEFDGKYFLEANLRRDGSSRFGENNRYGNFPSFSAGWIVSKEAFWNTKIINFLKFRASYGTLGSQNTALYPFASQVGLSNNYSINNINTSGGAINVLGNPDLKWESTTITDLGTNIELFNSRLTIEADYFIRDTKDILTPINNPLTLGVISPTITNAASVQNKGWEASANYNLKINAVNLSFGGNVTYVENKVTSINPSLSPAADKVELSSSSSIWLIRGQPVNAIYGYQVAGIFQSADEIASAPNHALFGAPKSGDFRIQDTDGDGVITNKDRIVMGNRQPKWLYGFNFKLNYKNFDFGVLFQGVGKFNTYQSRQVGPFAFAGIREVWLDRWTPENPSTTMPRIWIDRSGYNGASIETLPTSFWVQNLAYLRLKNVQIGYSLPKSLLSKAKIENVRLYLNGQNLLTFTNYKDFDPERLTTQQFVTNSLPQLKIITAGVNVTF